MAISIKVYGSTYTYTLSNLQNSITLTPSNRSQRYAQVYSKPTITRNKSGSANTRYFFLTYTDTVTPAYMIFQTRYVAAWKATFTKTGTTATVTEVNSGSALPLGHLARIMANANQSTNKTKFLAVSASETNSYNADTVWEIDTVGCTYNMSGWNPSAPTINYSLSQSETGDPDPSVFGYIVGYAKAGWDASGNTTWSYSLNGFSGTIAPKQTLSLSANGDSESSASGTGARSASLAGKLISATSVTGTAKLTNTIGGSATTTKTVTTQAYSKPTVSGLAIGRVTASGEANHGVMSIGWIVDALNKASSASQSITTGAITAAWSAEDLSDPGTVYASGEFDIISNGSAMTDVVDSTTVILTDTSGNGNDIYDTDQSYKFTVYITDRIGENSATISAILNSDFYIICVREGGRGIGFGIVPPADGFYVNMTANFQELTESSGSYEGGINDEALLTTDTINKWKTILGIS